MALLRVVDRRSGDRRRVTVTWVGEPPLAHETDVGPPVDEAASEKVRWYLEDYAEFPTDPAPAIARDAEARLAAVGRQLFERVFAGRGAAKVWARAEAELSRTRVEIDIDPSDEPGVPWELLRDPDTDQPVALGAAQFVRTHHETARSVALPEPTDEPLRVLLVICRPGGADDVPFRSVASRLVRSGVDRLAGLELHVLRPPTYPQLARVLRAAAEADRPFHIVHFDGHGTYVDPSALVTDAVALSRLTFSRRGRHGYLLFEDPSVASNQALVDGSSIGALLVENRVPVLVLNACRSAYAEAPAAPDPDAGVHDRIRAYGSLAAEIADFGVPGVVAMRYSVYVDTAARFVEDLYQRLAAGRPLGTAVSGARKALAADPNRQIGGAPVALQDWVVPTVYEPQPLTLRTPNADTPVLPEPTLPVPDAPDIGFFGRDDALLTVDRAFDTDQIVLLHALAGAGKSTTAAEFARWYTATGGLDGGAVLWTSFEHHMPLEQALDAAGVVFAGLLEANGIHWAAITDPAQRRSVIVQVLAAVPVLWVWDNVEPVAGFPTGTESAWTAEEQAELREFLRELSRSTRAKVLLTSRRDEHAWLGDLPRRVTLAPMPMRERLQLTHALVARLSGRRGEEIDWPGLLRFTGGNPLTITVLVRQAVLREKVATTEQLDAFVARVEAGTVALEPAQNAGLGRSGSLAASLAYGFAHTFTGSEQAQLALLHLFRDVVSVSTLHLMAGLARAGVEAVPALAEVDGDALAAVLRRAAELGLLVHHERDCYRIHPALPWFFTDLFGRHIPDAAAAERAYVRAYQILGNLFFSEIENGHAALLLPRLRAEEANLRHALLLARAHQLADLALGCAAGLYQLFALTGRGAEWVRLVDTLYGDYVDLATDRPRPGHEDVYSIVLNYRVRVARDQWDWPTATRLQTTLTAWDHDRAAPYRGRATEQLDQTGRYRLRAVAVSEQLLGNLLSLQGDPACRDHFQTSFALARQIEDLPIQMGTATNLGNAYLNVAGLHDLDLAQQWHQRALDLRPEQDQIGRAVSLTHLGSVACSRFVEARTAGARPEQLKTLFDQTRTHCLRSLDLMPDDHHDYRSLAHCLLGNVHGAVGDVRGALGHYQQSLQHDEARGNTQGAGITRFNIAIVLLGDGRASDALLYARAALTDFERIGPGAVDQATRVARFVRALEAQLGGTPSGRSNGSPEAGVKR